MHRFVALRGRSSAARAFSRTDGRAGCGLLECSSPSDVYGVAILTTTKEQAMSRIHTLLLSLSCILCLAAGAAVAADRPYTQGSVWSVTMVRVKPGMDNTYLADLATGW